MSDLPNGTPLAATTGADGCAVPPFPEWNQVDQYAPAADNERYVAILVVAYDTRDPLRAARLALDLTRDDAQGDTTWAVYDRRTGKLYRCEQDEFDRDDLLRWEDGGTDNPGDQNADSGQRVAAEATSAYYSLGPDGDGWAVELIQSYAGEPTSSLHLGRHPDEQSARERAQRYESTGT